MNTKNALALPPGTRPGTLYFLAGFTTDPQTGQQVQTTCAQLTPDHLDTIARALSFHLQYCEDMAAELQETVGDAAAAPWIAPADRDRKALRALQMEPTPDPEPQTMEEEPPGGQFAQILDKWTKALALILGGLLAFLVWDQTHR